MVSKQALSASCRLLSTMLQSEVVLPVPALPPVVPAPPPPLPPSPPTAIAPAVPVVPELRTKLTRIELQLPPRATQLQLLQLRSSM